MDSIFARYKSTLPQYDAQQLAYEGVTVVSFNFSRTLKLN